MKIKNKITLILVTAMVMTASMVVVAFAEILYLPQYSNVSDRYTQVYEMATSYNWRYTTMIGNKYGLTQDNVYFYGAEKLHIDRECAVQCTYNSFSEFETYYQVYLANTDIFSVSNSVKMKGTGYIELDYLYNTCDEVRFCLGIRNDPRKTADYVNKGNWSPDTYN